MKALHDQAILGHQRLMTGSHEGVYDLLRGDCTSEEIWEQFHPGSLLRQGERCPVKGENSVCPDTYGQ